jgi:hypothetical protein
MVGETITRRLRSGQNSYPKRGPVVGPVPLDERLEWYIAAFRKSSPAMKARYIWSLVVRTELPMAKIAAWLGISKSTAHRLFAVSCLPTEALKNIDEGRISVSVGYALSRIQEFEKQVALAREVAAGRLTCAELASAVKSARNGDAEREAVPTRVCAKNF